MHNTQRKPVCCNYQKEFTPPLSGLLPLPPVPAWPLPGCGSGTSPSLATPQRISEGDECSQQTAESTSSAASAWRSKRALPGCTLSGLQEPRETRWGQVAAGREGPSSPSSAQTHETGKLKSRKHFPVPSTASVLMT